MRATLAIFFLFLAGCASSSKVQDYLPDEYDDVSSIVQDNLAVAHASGTSLYTYAGVGLFVIGALSFAFFNRASGIQLIVAGAVAGSVPFIVSSVYFSWIVGATMLATAGIGIWHLWFKIKLAENAEEIKKP